MVKTPELDKLKKVQHESQAIGEFLDWLMNEKHIQLAEYGKGELRDDILYPMMHGSHGLIEELLAEFYGLDLDKMDKEREAIYQDLVERNKQAQSPTKPL